MKNRIDLNAIPEDFEWTDNQAVVLHALKKHGIVCKRGKCKVEYQGDIYELQDRKTGEPLFAAIPTNF